MYKIDCGTLRKADDILAQIEVLIDHYGAVSVADIHEITNDGIDNRADYDIGWVSKDSFEVHEDKASFYIYACDPRDLCPEKDDMVNHPSHYQSKNGLEAIQVIEAFTDKLHGIEATDTGNVIKYILRWHEKNGLEDLKKAKWYLEHLINHVEKENDKND